MPLSHFDPAYPSPSPCPQVHSLFAINVDVQVFRWIHVFISLPYIPRSGIARSNGNFMFNILKKSLTVFQNGCNILHS